MVRSCADHDDVVLGARRRGLRLDSGPVDIRVAGVRLLDRRVAFTLESAELPSSSATPGWFDHVMTSTTSPSAADQDVRSARAARTSWSAGPGLSQNTMWPASGIWMNRAPGLACFASAAPAAVTTGLSAPWSRTVGAGTFGQASKKSSLSKPRCVAAIAVSSQLESHRARSSRSRRRHRGHALATSSASVPRCASAS
jgi:hypothetical protein